MATTDYLANLGAALLASSGMDALSATQNAALLHRTLKMTRPHGGPSAMRTLAAVDAAVGSNVTQDDALILLEGIMNLPTDMMGDQSLPGIIVLTAAGIAVFSRLGWKLRGKKSSLGFDDAALVVGLAFCGGYVAAYTAPYISLLLGTHSWNVALQDLRYFIYTTFYTNILIILSLAFTKLSLLTMYYNYINSATVSRATRMTFWCISIFVACCTSATFFGSFGLCGKFHFWNYYPNYAAAKCANLPMANLAAGILDVLQVASMLLFPATFFFSSSSTCLDSVRGLLSSILILTLGLITLVCSVMRTSTLDSSYSSSDATRSLVSSIQWAETELCVALTTVSLIYILFNISPRPTSPYDNFKLPRSTSFRKYNPRRHLSKLSHSNSSSTRNLRDEDFNPDRSSTATMVVIHRLSDAEKPRLREICISPTSAFSPTNQPGSPQFPRPALVRNQSSLSDMRVFKESRVSIYEVEVDEEYGKAPKESIELVDIDIGFDGRSTLCNNPRESSYGFEPRGADWQQRERLRLDLETGHNRRTKDITGLTTSVTGGL